MGGLRRPAAAGGRAVRELVARRPRNGHLARRALDPSAELLARARHAALSRGCPLSLRQGTIDDLGQLFESDTYTNELGVRASAHRLDDVRGWCRELGLRIEAWYGVRVFTDGVDTHTPPDDDTLEACLKAEEEAGRRDPYRRLASQLHVLARCPPVTR